MRTPTFITALLTAFACATPSSAAPPPDAAPATATASVKVGAVTLTKAFKGPEGIKLEVAYLDGTPKRALVRVSGTGTAWDGKAVLHDVQVNGEKEDFATLVNGRSWVSVTVRGAYGGARSWQIYVPGLSTEPRVEFDEKLTAALDGKAMAGGKVFETGDAASGKPAPAPAEK